MLKIEYMLPSDLLPYVNCVMVGKSEVLSSHTNIPLYADGYPGIMFQCSEEGFYLLPKKKKLSELFLYGQTLLPVSLDVKGKYEYIVVQLYPFVSKYLLGIDPKTLNDDCFDLYQLKELDIVEVEKKIKRASNVKEQITILFDLIRDLIKLNESSQNYGVEKAIKIIIEKKGNVKMFEVLEDIFMTERTFERNFKKYIGLSPKQFARIIQFQTSLKGLENSENLSTLEVGLDSGFSDQSHFIKTFKSYTGKTPKFYLKQMNY